MLNNLSSVYHSLGRYGASLASLESALRQYEQLVPENHPTLGASHANLSETNQQLGHLANAMMPARYAVASDRASLPADHPALVEALDHPAASRHRLGWQRHLITACRLAGDLAAARALARKQIALADRADAPDWAAIDRLSRATIAAQAGETDADRWYRDAAAWAGGQEPSALDNDSTAVLRAA